MYLIIQFFKIYTVNKRRIISEKFEKASFVSWETVKSGLLKLMYAISQKEKELDPKLFHH